MLHFWNKLEILIRLVAILLDRLTPMGSTPVYSKEHPNNIWSQYGTQFIKKSFQALPNGHIIMISSQPVFAPSP